MLLLSFLFQQPALAVPVQLSQQGRLLESDGAPVDGSQVMTFRIYDEFVGGDILWSESLQVSLTNGYYSVVLGANTASNALEDDVLASYPLYLEIEINEEGPIGLRKEIVSTPFARLSGTAKTLEGGSVNATQISINGSMVIDSSGGWVGQAHQIQWGTIQNIPAGLDDGDDDSLSLLSCSAGEIVGWNGSQWVCTSDASLSEAEVEQMIINGGIDLHSQTTQDGLPILKDGDPGTLSGLSCLDGEFASWDVVLGDWICGVKTDVQLTENEVEGYITNGVGAFDLSQGTTLNGQLIRTSADPTIHDIVCQQGEILAYDTSSGWVCQTFQAVLDADGDGALSWDDCDDTDEQLLSQKDDADCDGFRTIEDCDDNDPNSYGTSQDADCDGILTADDCDDNDVDVGSNAQDQDCDGVLTADDCDDNDASSQGSGQNESCPGLSCKDILENGSSVGDGLYWIDHAGTGAFQVHCDMSIDGGGWTRIARFTPYSQPSWNTLNYLASISSASFPADPSSGNWMVGYPHDNLEHDEVLINSTLNEEWLIHGKNDNGWTSSFIGTGGTYPSNEYQNAIKNSWGSSDVWYWWCESNSCNENLNQSSGGCEGVKIPIDDACSGHSSAVTFISVR